MKRLTELETKEDFAELEEILSKVRSGNIIGTMRQAVKHNDEYSYVDIEQAVSESEAIVYINEGFLYVVVQNVRNEQVRKIRTMWNMVLQRGTQRFVSGEANDYLLTIDLVCNELEGKGLVYCISAVQPVFVSSESNRALTLVFPINSVRCAKDEISLYDVEYEAALREESGNDVYNMDKYVGDEDDEGSDTYEENNDIIGTDEYAVGSSYIDNDED